MIRVTATTDGKYIGVIADIDPRNPPAVIPVGDGSLFDPVSWVEVAPGKWRVANPNYTVMVEEI